MSLFNPTTWNPDACAYPAYFKKVVEAHSNKVAVRSVDGELTYQQLDRLSDGLAMQLIESGIQSEELVCVATGRNHEYLVATLAISKAGGCFVPIDLSLPSDRVAMIVEDADVKRFVVATHGEHYPVPEGVEVFRVPDQEVDTGDVAWPVIATDQLAYSMFTSGSTGRPKGVMIEHRSMMNFCHSITAELGLDENDRFISVASVGFDLSVFELFVCLSHGATVYFASQEQVIDGQALVEIFEEESITQMTSTTGTLRLMIEAGWQGSKDLTIMFAGELMPLDLSTAVMSLPSPPRYTNYYGPTEATVVVTGHETNDPKRAHLIGWEMGGCQFMVVDENDQEVADGEIGELVIGGICLARGYLGRPKLTAEKFREFKGFGRGYLTGDLGKKHPEDGVFECLGRNDTQIKIRGFRVELGEIERVVTTHPLVQQVIVKKWTDEKSGIEYLTAYIVPAKAPDDLPEGWQKSIREHSAASLSHYMVPEVFVAMESFPVNVNGKVDRNKFSAPGRSLGEVEKDSIAKGELEKQIAAAWCEVLGLPQVPRDAKFFELGGKSVQVARLFTKIKPLSQIENLKVANLFEATTVADQAKLLSGTRKGASKRKLEFQKRICR